MTNITPTTRVRGRPREFDIDKALDGAIDVFREKGYQATSIADLRKGMQLASGSIYKAFKDKRAIFIAALERYIFVRKAALSKQLVNANNGLEKVHATLLFYVDSSSLGEGERGCLIVSCSTDLALFDTELANKIRAALDRNRGFLEELIIEGQQDGSISADIDSMVTAELILCILQGMRVVGKTGRTREQMTQTAEMAMNLLK